MGKDSSISMLSFSSGKSTRDISEFLSILSGVKIKLAFIVQSLMGADTLWLFFHGSYRSFALSTLAKKSKLSVSK
jgi:hypothetical protein